MIRIAIITCSDTRTAATDTAGAALAAECARLGWQVIAAELVPDDANSIASAIARIADEMGADVILTTGGTGFGPRDVTPEATRMACDREVPGISEWIRAKSMGVTRRAMLSRATSGLRGRTLVVNLPGSKEAALESFGFVFDQFDHAVQMMHGGGHDA